MSYTITKTNGSLLGINGTILDGTINTDFTSLTLIGRNYANYGQLVAENFVHLVENFAYGTEPSNSLAGQIWWNTSDKRLRVATADGGPWKVISSATTLSIISYPAGPSNPIQGDLWWETDYNQLYGYSGSAWILIGPQRNNSGAIWEQIYDISNEPHDVVSIKLDGVRTAIISQDAAFTPNVSIAGYSGDILPGYNMSSADTIWGLANNASYLGGNPASSHWRNTTNNSGTGTLTIVNDSGITVGLGGDLTLNVDGTDAQILNNTNGGALSFYTKATGSSVQYLTITSSGTVEVAANPTTNLGVATKQYIDNKFYDTVLYGVPVAPTAPAGTSNTMIATTEFVTSGLSGLYPYKIYQNNTWVWVNDTGSNGSANIVMDGTTVLTASASGVNLFNGATAATQPDTYNGSGNARVATTQFVKTASTWWGNASHRSAKWVSTDAPDPGINDIGSNNGDFWFQREA